MCSVVNQGLFICMDGGSHIITQTVPLKRIIVCLICLIIVRHKMWKGRIIHKVNLWTWSLETTKHESLEKAKHKRLETTKHESLETTKHERLETTEHESLMTTKHESLETTKHESLEKAIHERLRRLNMKV